jgi:GNAT superfamily N-acetyltransferase
MDQNQPAFDSFAAARAATRSDVPALVAMLHALAWHRGEPCAATEAALRRDLFGASRPLDVYVAEICGTVTCGIVVGFLAAARVYDAGKARRSIEIRDLYVVPELRGRGVGRALVEACRAHAAALGAPVAIAGALRSVSSPAPSHPA